jgi:hypothetical protein
MEIFEFKFSVDFGKFLIISICKGSFKYLCFIQQFKIEINEIFPTDMFGKLLGRVCPKIISTL